MRLPAITLLLVCLEWAKYSVQPTSSRAKQRSPYKARRQVSLSQEVYLVPVGTITLGLLTGTVIAPDPMSTFTFPPQALSNCWSSSSRKEVILIVGWPDCRIESTHEEGIVSPQGRSVHLYIPESLLYGRLYLTWGHRRHGSCFPPFCSLFLQIFLISSEPLCCLL